MILKHGKRLALGIHWAHDASAAVCSPDGVLCSIAEERIARVKHYYGFPMRAIEATLRQCNLTPDEIDVVGLSARFVLFPDQPRRTVVTAEGERHATDVSPAPALERIAARVRRLLGRPRRRDRAPRVEASWQGFEERHWSHYAARLRELGLIGPRLRHYYVAHHRAHAASAFRLSGRSEACVVTLDGKGDKLSGAIYRGAPSGDLELLRASRAQDSLGSFYQAVTEALGFVPVDGEFKTMGLAALGRETGAPNPLETVRVEDGVLRSQIEWSFRRFNERYPERAVPNPLGSVAETERFREFLDEMPPEQLAYYAQSHCEEVMLQYVRDALRLTGCRDLVAAGGVWLNVKANARIREELQPSSFFVFPDAADSGLAAGAAMEALHQEGALTHRARFDSPYLGHGYESGEIWNEIDAFTRERPLVVKEAGDDVAAFLVERLSAGTVIGTFQGRLEMGPRALGNRSVLADPRSVSIKERINALLKGREYFVPFAPVVLDEDAPRLWDGSCDYPYMTMAVQASEFARRAVPAVVHVDGTLRPQVVTARTNSWLHALLRHCKQAWGVGVLVNTSFNRHGHPIVAAPRDALEHLANGWVDAVILDRWYVERLPD